MGMYCTGMYRCCVDCCSTSIAEGAEVRAPSLSQTVVLCHTRIPQFEIKGAQFSVHKTLNRHVARSLF